MLRSSHAVLTLLLIGGVAAALVRTRDSGARRAAMAAEAGGPRGRLAQHLQDVGHTISAEYVASPASGATRLRPPGDSDEPGLLASARDAQPAGGLRSVLTRRTTLDDRSAPTDTPAEPPAAEEVRAPVPPPPPEPASRPRAVELPDAAVDRGAEVEVSDTARTSSRRTHREPDAPASPALVPSTPIATRPTSPATHPVSQSTSNTIASSTGALLRVATVGPDAVTVGTMAEIAIYLSNLGSSEARDVTVRVALPANLEMISAEVEDGSTRMQDGGTGSALIWTVDRVPARAERILTLKAVPQSTEPLELPVEWSQAPVSSVARIQVQQPRLELALRGAREIAYGETKIFTVSVSNPGTGEARDVSLRLALGAESADTLQIGTIAAGAHREFQVEVTARQAGPMQIQASASGAGGLAAEAQENLLVRRADLEIETLGSGVKYAGSVGTYQIRVANRGDASAANVRATVRLPKGARYVQGLEQVEEEGQRLHWQVGTLEPGEERIYRLFCQVSEEGEARLEFTVRDDADLMASGTVTTQVRTIADLKMIVNNPKGPVPVGKLVEYEVHVTNRGTKEATQVQVIAQFSEGIEPAAADGARAEIVPGQVVFQPIARLNAGETIKLTVKAKAEKDGTHLFRAELRSGDPEYRLVSENTTAFFTDDLTLLPIGPGGPASQRADRSPSDADDVPAPLTGVRSGWNTR